MRQLLNTTTALIASLSLVVPGPLVAQEIAGDALMCLDGTKTPCLPGQEPLDANGVPVPDTTMTEEQQAAAKAAAAQKAADEAAAAAQKAADDAAAAEAAAAAQKAADDAAAAEAAAAAQKAADDAAAAEAAAAAQKAADDAAAAEAAAAAQKAADDAAAAEAAAATQKAADDAAAAEAAAAAQKAADDAAAAEAAAAAQKAADDAAAAEAAAAAQKAADDAAAAEAAAAAQKAADDAAAAEAAAATQKAADDAAAAEAAAAAQKAADEAAAAAAAQKAADDAAATQKAAEDTVPTPEDLAKALAEQAGTVAPPADAAPVPDLPVQPEAETGAAPVAEAAALPVAETGDTGTAAPAADVTVTEETVTEGSVRTSDQDFANRVNEASPAAAAAAATAPQATATATAAAPAARKKDGLSDAEKVILLGLGAVAVGAILSNNRKVELNSGDRVVVMRDDGTQQVIKDDDALLRRPGDRVRTERFGDGSTRTTVLRGDGSRIVTIRDAEYRVLRRVLVDDRGRESVLIDDTVSYEPVIVSELPKPRRHPVIEDTRDEDALRAALADEGAFDRRFSLSQVRNIREVRDLVPVIDLNAITFASGSAAITPDQAQTLAGLGRYIRDTVRDNPREVFLIEGHTDAVGSAAYNLALSDRRAESVALALTEYFQVPPENLVVQGYGEEFLRVDTQLSERLNRRASVRRITDLLRQAAAE